MNYRFLGRTGISVSDIGFGTWGIGGATDGATSYGQTDDISSLAALNKAVEEGVNFFDTATAYGRSEELLGKVLGSGSSKRDGLVIATKVGISRHYEPPDFSKKAIVESLHNSLKRLRTDYIDVLQLYNPSFGSLVMNDILETLVELKEKGLIRSIGASVKTPSDGLVALSFLEIEVIQTNLNMLDQRALDNGLLKSAEKLGVGIIARTPLCFGFLTGTITTLDFDPQDHRSQWPLKQLEAWQKGAQVFFEANLGDGWPLYLLALRFCLDSPGVSTVIQGSMSVKEVLKNVAASQLPRLESKKIEQIRKIYRDNNQFFVKPN